MSKISEFLKTRNWLETAIIISPTSFTKLDDASIAILEKNKQSRRFTHSLTFSSVIEEIRQEKPLKSIIGLGGGTALDLAKYTAFQLKIPWIAIPSMLSTNAYATNKVAVIDEKGKHTEQGKLPAFILFDDEYLKKSSRENLYGLVDVFSIYTALTDWRIANLEIDLPIDSKIFHRADTLLWTAINIANRENPETSIDDIAYAVGLAGHITNVYGSGRPESGSEHIFASALELICPMPHALAVTLGVYIMDYIQTLLYPSLTSNNEIRREFIPFDKLGIIEDINSLGISWSTVETILKGLKPRADKVTVVNYWDSNRADFEWLKHYLEKQNFKFV